MFKLLLILILPLCQNSDKRIFELYTTDIYNPAYQQQLRVLVADEQGLKERDVLVKTFLLNAANKDRFKTKSIKENFMAILIGKDGGEKFRSDKVMPLQKLYGIIDAMPMRRDEMKHKNGH